MLKCIPVSDLRLGMYIHDMDASWFEHGFWTTSFLLSTPQDLQRLQTSGVNSVWIDTDRGLDALALFEPEMDSEAAVSPEAETLATESEASALNSPPTDELPSSDSTPEDFEAELQRAIELRQQARQAVKDLFKDARMGKIIQVEQAQHLVAGITQSVLRNADALSNLVRLKTADDYTYMHSVAVCVLMIKLALQLKLSEEMTYEAGLAGLLHDVGKVAIPDEILNKPGRLSDAEFSVIRQHPEAGTQILRRNLSLSSHVLDVCLHHHEKIDGTGYPHKLPSERISLLARMGAICDVYDAVTSNRPYKDPWGPSEALHQMATWKNHFDPQILKAFVKAMGVYPTGSLVRLKSGRLAIVLEQHPNSLLTPRVKVFFCGTTGRHLLPQVVDLAHAEPEDGIASRESPDQWGFKNLDSLWTNFDPRSSAQEAIN